ncbi:putative RNA recognition motif domain, nucleotide-binding alpha-beta plait domain superfamily [Helianthus annuus]|uniref:RNA recognition motif domain, nucleotide-binding alpha-beta plait domain superfamily n=1 Tax=Helianthus annuus TaxID=4232 RepID=A0A9K3JFC0_HELAN|nr:putative RNA recognition motif domain, nucleotide-binding alpha-beta plait domain superfamily [Helianthus annuus]KAJ0607307.1 putative RNA recognition motif domain, nucleotide-binding alpha-beta plait domain superfamily [Helianthus annuus]KAJ0767367.1 putative RNA recognition motif domain, nucleotide-binding alpha-beta plait domain superfamily [Helianthus annuus]KAJ0773209.1 putative RNA recognition motif domain, nucleotide-binding alpha-beta plait domain superfamily [Helianthus annuus]KAJ09
MDSEEWEQPRNRKGKRNDRQAQGNNKVLSKFFVSNLPPKCSSQDLKEVLGSFGRYEGSYIARKLDKWGKRFAFVSFSDVKDVKRLGDELSDVWIGSYKLFIAIARFVDGEKVDRPDSVNRRTATSAPVNSHANPSGHENPVSEGSDGNGGVNASVGNGRSFVDSLLNRNKVDVIKVDDSVERFSHWRDCALTGRVVNFHTLTSLKKLIRTCGWRSLDIKYLGGLSVVLVFYDSGDRDVFLNYKDTWSKWFEFLDVWSDNASVEEGRIAWFQVYGIPAQLALDGVFDLIGSRFGKVVQSASLSGDDNNFSYALIGVLSKECKRIADRVDINWRGRIFKVWVDEDLGEWMPECVAEDEEDDGSVLPEEDKCHDNIVQDDVNTVNREEGECSQANDVSVGDFDGNGLDGCANDIPNEVVSEPSNVHDFSNEVLVENDNVDNISAPVLKGTGRKKFRRKSLVTNRSGGSGSSERPKKRPRENNDMFDIDRLIGGCLLIRRWLATSRKRLWSLR